MMTITMAIAAATLTCVGGGVRKHEGPPKTESRSGNGWVDDFNNSHDGFTARTRLEDGEDFRVAIPIELSGFPGLITMVKLSDTGGVVRASKTMGMVYYTATYDRNRSILVVTTPDGTYTARCGVTAPRVAS